MRIYKAGKKFGVDFTWRGGRVRLVGYSSKRPTEALGRKLEALAACREAGERPDRELSAWLEDLPYDIKEKLVKQGLLDGSKLEACKTIFEHLNDYKGYMESKGRKSRHIQQEISKIEKAVHGCGFSKLTDINADKFSDYLYSKLEDDVSPRTVNGILVAMRAFLNSLVRMGRIPENPLKCLQQFDVKSDVRRVRRALSDSDFNTLLTVTATQEGIFRCMIGKDWALLFRLAAETGFRWSELRSLTRSHFNDLDSNTPSVSIDGKDTKNGKAYTQPLREVIARDLNDHLRLKLPGAPAFDLPFRDCGYIVMQHYLELAGIPYKDAAGRVFDFHALRGQFATSLARNGVSLAAARELMRHSTVDLTAKHYTHLSLEDRREAISKLPDTEIACENAELKTGTYGDSEAGQNNSENFCRISAKSLPNCADSEHMLVDTSGQNTIKPADKESGLSSCISTEKPRKRSVFEAKKMGREREFESPTFRATI